METVYYIAFFTGLGFALVSAFMSDLFHAHAGGDSSADPGMGHGVGDTSTVDGSGGLHFPILSPLGISTFVATFGGTGIILLGLQPGWAPLVHIGVSALAGTCVSAAVVAMFGKLFGRVQGSSAPRDADLVGLVAQVTVAIPAEGMGQIRYLANGTHFTGIGRSENKIQIPQGEEVKILRVSKGTFYVRPAKSEGGHP